MEIEGTTFGTITIDGKTYEHDVIIRLSGEVVKRKKKLSKKYYGTSHVLSKDEAKFVFEGGCEQLILGSGQMGNVHLSPEAEAYFEKKGCKGGCQLHALAGALVVAQSCSMSRISYRGYRFPPDIIQRAVWLYFRFTLSLRDVEDLLAERGIEVSYETIRQWVMRFGPAIARDLRSRRPRPYAQWHLDEMFVSIGGKWMYLWRAVDAEGEVLDCLVQSRRDKRAAKKLMRMLLKKQGFAPSHLVTDDLKSYPAAFQGMGLTAVHHRGKRMNNRAESSHVPIRRRERKMQGFKSAKSAQRFLATHAPIYNTFNTCRHLISATNHRTFRREAMTLWRQAACVAA